MSKSKVHSKNGFEYKCKRSFYGSWNVEWLFKPEDAVIFIHYFCDSYKTIKKDIEKFLLHPIKAKEYYFHKLTQLSDVEAARKELEEANKNYNKVNSPDFDLGGSNPNKEERVRKKATIRLHSAENKLERAIKYSEILKGSL